LVLKRHQRAVIDYREDIVEVVSGKWSCARRRILPTSSALSVLLPLHPYALLVFVLRGVCHEFIGRDVCEYLVVVLAFDFSVLDGGHVDLALW
jgi:hypothetical protein